MSDIYHKMTRDFFHQKSIFVDTKHLFDYQSNVCTHMYPMYVNSLSIAVMQHFRSYDIVIKCCQLAIGIPTSAPPSMCSSGDRLRRVKRWCKIQKNVNNKPFPRYEELDTEALQKVVKRLLVDDKHKVLYCEIAKSG